MQVEAYALSKLMAVVYGGNPDLVEEYFKDAASGLEPLTVIVQAAVDRHVVV